MYNDVAFSSRFYQTEKRERGKKKRGFIGEKEEEKYGLFAPFRFGGYDGFPGKKADDSLINLFSSSDRSMFALSPVLVVIYVQMNLSDASAPWGLYRGCAPAVCVSARCLVSDIR